MTMDEISTVVSNLIGIDVADIRQSNGMSRKDSIVIARHAVISLARELTELTLSRIADYFNFVSHASIINAVKKCNHMRDTNREFRHLYLRAKKVLDMDKVERELMFDFLPFVYIANVN